MTLQAEDIVVNPSAAEAENGKLWSKGKILLWKPGNDSEMLRFIISKQKDGGSNFGMTIAHMPQGGAFMVLLNGETVQFNSAVTINSNDSSRTYLRNYISAPIPFRSGENEIVIRYIGKVPGEAIGIDFFWLKDR